MPVQLQNASPSSPFASWKGQHAGIRVPDFAACVAWYREKLDFRLVQSMTFGATTFGFLAPAVDNGFRLEILANPNGIERPAYTDLPDSHKIMGWHHICFSTDNLHDSVDELKRRGVAMVSEPIDVKELGIRFVFLADPWGNLFELMQPLQDPSDN
ncbi:VOC family protein [Agrobacterium vitis]|uniref:VOC family protein n=1 Tax=Agrobacterium vitis TaxID=373 RepID=UPI0012E85247|nr:VOC family protein [Agrobacterium vitis]MVA23466.1 VOC family protein [Agrobacterium vitis]